MHVMGPCLVSTLYNLNHYDNNTDDLVKENSRFSNPKTGSGRHFADKHHRNHRPAMKTYEP